MKQSREEKIEKIHQSIQKKIDQLKKLNCRLDSGYGGIGIVDDNTEESDFIHHFDTSNPKRK